MALNLRQAVTASVWALLIFAVLFTCVGCASTDDGRQFRDADGLIESLRDAGFSGQFSMFVSPFTEIGIKQAGYIANNSWVSASGQINPALAGRKPDEPDAESGMTMEVKPE